MTRMRFAKADGGAAAIEFAIMGAALCLLVVATGDLGMGFYSYMQVQNSAQAGAEYAAMHGYDSAAITTAVTNATSTPGITASPVPTKFCGCPSGTMVTATACGNLCASDGTTAGTYVTASAARTYSTLISYPLFPATYQQTSTATVRIQ